MGKHLPLVSVVTPVFNGEKYLRRCIESILAQTYENWNYTIVNNCSTDKSLEIAQAYSVRDRRITVRTNEHFVGAIQNHNIAFRCISPESKYCKLVSADDWIYPECIAKLVDLAERYPSVGVVGSYWINAKGVPWLKLPLDESVFDGRQICRQVLLGSVERFWLPSSVLYRSSLVRAEHDFFPGSAPSADLEACLNCLKVCDLGFVHQLLAYERLHEEAITAKVGKLNVFLLDRMRILKELGPRFLGEEECRARMEVLLSQYYGVLGVAWFKFRGQAYWRLQKETLEELGYSLYSLRLARAVGANCLDLLFNPKETIETVVRWARAYSRRSMPSARPATVWTGRDRDR